MRLILGLLLNWVARVLFLVLLPFGVLVGLCRTKALGGDQMRMALELDKFGNGVYGALLNMVLRKPGGYAFGDYDETISKVLGKNKAMGTLSVVGRLVADILNWIDKDHVEKASKS